jgi:hypothetical protein
VIAARAGRILHWKKYRDTPLAKICDAHSKETTTFKGNNNTEFSCVQLIERADSLPSAPESRATCLPEPVFV